jgi:predicted metal-dependent peptidase
VTSGGLDRLSSEERRRWAAARVWSAHQAPYLASALLALEPVVVVTPEGVAEPPWDLRALPVDRGWHVYLDPQVLASTEVAELGFWLVHQVSHLLRHHAARSPVADDSGVPSGPGLSPPSARGVIWNEAADAEIDDDLEAGQLELPPGAVTPSSLGLPDALTAEQYWDLLGPAQDRAPDRGPDRRDCGSGCDGRPRPWDGGGDGLGETSRRLVERDVARRILEHQRRRGTMPAGWTRWAEEVLEPTVSWRRLLASAVRQGLAEVAGRVDFTYRKPSRRASATPDVVLPSMRQPLPKVAMVLDTSGSMSDGMLAQCLGEVGGVLRSLGVARQALRIVCCDAQAYEAQRVMKAGDVELLGGGGTDMGAGLARAAELRPRPDLVIVLTDGLTPWPPTAPAGVRVIVGLLADGGQPPSWATTVRVGDGSR